MSNRLISRDLSILDAKGATGAGNAINVADYRHVVLFFATDGGGDAALTAKVQGSIADTEPTWASAQSVSNKWDYIQMKDLEDASTADGDVGFVVATADDYRMYEVNVNGLEWLNVNVTARTAGELTVVAKCFTNE